MGGWWSSKKKTSSSSRGSDGRRFVATRHTYNDGYHECVRCRGTNHPFVRQYTSNGYYLAPCPKGVVCKHCGSPMMEPYRVD